MTGRRKPAEDRAVKRMPRNDSVPQRSRRKKMQQQLQETSADAGAMAQLLSGIEAARENPAADNPPNAMIRRQIEMYREARLLRQQLIDSFDP